ncbi:MAG: hypothetical protein ACOX4U_02940 [Anaerovoracaceae bacterium]
MRFPMESENIFLSFNRYLSKFSIISISFIFTAEREICFSNLVPEKSSISIRR